MGESNEVLSGQSIRLRDAEILNVKIDISRRVVSQEGLTSGC
jgi:hypothetical protein